MPRKEPSTLRELLWERGIDVDDLKDHLIEFLDTIGDLRVDSLKGTIDRSEHWLENEEEKSSSSIGTSPFGFDFSPGPLSSKVMSFATGLRATHQALEQLLPAISAIDRLGQSEFFHRLRRPYRRISQE